MHPVGLPIALSLRGSTAGASGPALACSASPGGGLIAVWSAGVGGGELALLSLAQDGAALGSVALPPSASPSAAHLLWRPRLMPGGGFRLALCGDLGVTLVDAAPRRASPVR